MWRKYRGLSGSVNTSCWAWERICPTAATWTTRTVYSKPAVPSSASSRALKRIVFDKIRVNGPITVAEYMKLASSTYYSMHDSTTEASYAGIGDDFVTSPEISQMFGELISVWCAYETWKIGHRGPWQVVELGPGNGSLMFDFLKTLQQLRVIREGDDHQLSVHLVELSDALAARQECLLCSEGAADSTRSDALENDSISQHRTSSGVRDSEKTYFKKSVTNFGPSVSWYKDLDDVPRQFSVILAHEFFDALPVHKFQRCSNGWREVYIDADFSQDGLKFVLAPGETFASRTYLTKDILELLPQTSDHVEISPHSLHILQQMMDRITEDGGAILIIDYGYDSGHKGDTLRGFRKHRLIENFLDEEPGSYDITADVNFQYLKKWADEKVCCFGPLPQGQFLKNLGIDVRLKRLLENAKTEEDKNYLRSSYEMLVNEGKMGARFKVLALYPKVLKPYLELRPPAGFAALG